MSLDTGWPLAGLRIVDLSTEIAGPYCSKMLVDGGANVIKVEPPGGDPLRRWTASGTALPPGTDGALFQHLNASKRSVVADPATSTGRQFVLDLVATADLVIESFSPGTLAQLGLTLGVLQRHNPAVSLVSISPWGSTGPWAQRAATEFTLQAATGSTDFRCPPGRTPVAAGGRIGEWVAGTFAAAGALCAWRAARQTGRGQHVDVSVFESMLLSFLSYFDIAGQWGMGPLRRGVEVPSVEPALDGWVGFSPQTGQQWKDFCLLIQQPQLAEEEQYFNGWARAVGLPVLRPLIHQWTRQHTVEEIIDRATALRIPVAPVGNGQNIPHMDHFVARDVFGIGPGGFVRPRPPYQLTRTVLRPFGHAPRLDEDRADVLAELRHARPAVAPTNGAPARAPATLPLAGLRVIDLTAFWAGPFGGGYLADMGADVIKVESIQRPDGMRFVAGIPREPMWEWSPVFAGANPGKRDVTLDLTDPEGRALLARLIRSADVVMENFSVRVLEHFGLSWDAIHTLNPRTIMVRMPAFGLDGPWRDRIGFAPTVEQVSGMAWMTGYEDMPLTVRSPADPVSGLNAVFAVLLALEDRRRTGVGQLIEVPLVEAALNLGAEQVIEYSAYGTLLTRQGNRGPHAAPQGVYPCAERDEYVAIAVATDGQWQALCALMGNPAWAQAASLCTATGRRAAHDMIDARVAEWLATLPQDVAVEQLLNAGVPAQALINAIAVAPNPQLEHRRFFQVMVHPVTGETRYPGLPMAFSALDRDLHRRPPPTLGQHNDEILGSELRLSPEELRNLRARKIIGERPAFM